MALALQSLGAGHNNQVASVRTVAAAEHRARESTPVFRMSFGRLVTMAAGTTALLGVLVLGAAGRLPLHGALGTMLRQADYVDSGVRIVPPPPTSMSGGEGESLGEEPDGMSRTDLEGDEVSPALATYGIDREGNLFEVHSPHTEVPRLAGPTT